MAALHHGVQPVLGGQHVLDIAGTQADAGESPLMGNARAGQVVEIHGLVGAMKIARSDVYYAALQGRPVVSGDIDALRLRVQWQGVVAERNSGAWPPRNHFSHPPTVPTIRSQVNV